MIGLLENRLANIMIMAMERFEDSVFQDMPVRSPPMIWMAFNGL
ncbi:MULTISPECIES: hypothetical protein [Ahrensia]|nr:MULTISPECIES: hypothetical protein [Ahrensia]